MLALGREIENQDKILSPEDIQNYGNIPHNLFHHSKCLTTSISPTGVGLILSWEKKCFFVHHQKKVYPPLLYYTPKVNAKF